jgi:multiple antibiotic resistance protein
LVEIFIALFIGMGPIKVLLVYIASTEGMEKEVRRKVAQRTVLVAGAVGIALFLIGAILQAMLHFSIGALTIFGGLILLILALNMVIGGSKSSNGGHGDTDPMGIAISPLAIPLTLNPVGIVILMTASVQVQDLGLGVVLVVMILIIMGIDLAVLYGSDRVAKYLSHATVELLERVLGILLGALAVELIITGINSTGIFSELLK